MKYDFKQPKHIATITIRKTLYEDEYSSPRKKYNTSSPKTNEKYTIEKIKIKIIDK